MNSESLANALSRIERDAVTQQVDLADPVNAFTVWADLQPFMKHCGSCTTFDAASSLASGHLNHEDLYIVYSEITPLGITKFERT